MLGLVQHLETCYGALPWFSVVLKSECLFIGKCCVVWFLLEAKILKKENKLGN